MSAFRIIRRLRDQQDVDTSGAAVGDALVLDVDGETWVPGAGGGGGGGAPTTSDYLVGTAQAGLSAEIVVGTSPGGELGGTWASPTVDTTHSGSSHASVQSAAEATAAAALSSHAGDTTAIHGIADTSVLLTTAAGDAAYQPKDSDLTAIAALTTTSFGRALLALADQAALLSAAGAAAASHVHAGEDITSGTVADARIASTIARDSEVTSAISALSSVYQPLDSDLTSIAALTTTSFGRAFLALADAAAARSATGAAPVAAKYIVQTADSELSAEQALGALATGIVKNTTTTGVLSIATAGTDYYNPGGTDVALADGGTGASLVDPNADRIMFWDDSAGSVAFLTPGTNLTITGTTIDAAGGSAATETRYLPISLANPDASAFWTVGSLTAWDAARWEFVKDVVGNVYGIVRVPKEIHGTPNAAVVLEIMANATSGVTSLQVLSKNVADGGSMNPASLTAETQQDITVPGTAYLRKQVTFALTNAPAGDDVLIVQVKHNGTHANDTLAVNTLLLSAALKIDCLPA